MDVGLDTGGVPSSAFYRERLAAFRRSDRERDDLVDDLIQKNEDLRDRLSRLSDDYSREQDSSRAYFSKVKKLEQAVNEQKRSIESNSLAFVLIDGDGALFLDELYAIANGEGGAEAAHRLQTDIKKHLKNAHPDANVEEWNIIVHIYLNVDGMSRVLGRHGIVRTLDDVPSFGRAFGIAQPLFTFVDVGKGKERADHRIREMLRVMVRNPTCRHIVFGPCHDNGYLPVLEPYKRDIAISQKLTLIDAGMTQPGFRQLGFSLLSFPSVFRSEPLPDKPAAVHEAPPASAPLTNGHADGGTPAYLPAPAPAPPVLPASAPPASAPPPSITPPGLAGAGAAGRADNTYASISKTTSVKTINITPTTAKKTVLKSFLVNRHGERIDEPLPRYDPIAERRFNERMEKYGRYCNFYHLTGNCPNGEFCHYQHGERLGPSELAVLRHKARALACEQSVNCRDFDCPYAHHCKFGGRRCENPKCRFADTHFVELRPVKRIFEDFHEESLAV